MRRPRPLELLIVGWPKQRAGGSETRTAAYGRHRCAGEMAHIHNDDCEFVTQLERVRTQVCLGASDRSCWLPPDCQLSSVEWQPTHQLPGHHDRSSRRPASRNRIPQTPLTRVRAPNVAAAISCSSETIGRPRASIGVTSGDRGRSLSNARHAAVVQRRGGHAGLQPTAGIRALNLRPHIGVGDASTIGCTVGLAHRRVCLRQIVTRIVHAGSVRPGLKGERRAGRWGLDADS